MRGQVWKYQTRAGEEGSRAIIGKVDMRPDGALLVHVQLTNLVIRNPHAEGGASHIIQHLPMSEEAVIRSVHELQSEDGLLSGFEEGYDTWLEAYRTGRGGAFTTTLAEAADYVEQALCGGRITTK
jgi:hypothetical protein